MSDQDNTGMVTTQTLEANPEVHSNPGAPDPAGMTDEQKNLQEAARNGTIEGVPNRALTEEENRDRLARAEEKAKHPELNNTDEDQDKKGEKADQPEGDTEHKEKPKSKKKKNA